MSRLLKFFALPPRQRSLLSQAVLHLTLARVVLALLSFRRVMDRYNGPLDEAGRTGASPANTELEEVAWAIAVVERNLPWRSKCLVQAVAGKSMLRKRGLASTLHLGVSRDRERSLAAHAWLECDGKILTGASEMDDYTVVSSFREADQ